MVSRLPIRQIPDVVSFASGSALRLVWPNLEMTKLMGEEMPTRRDSVVRIRTFNDCRPLKAMSGLDAQSFVDRRILRALARPPDRPPALQHRSLIRRRQRCRLPMRDRTFRDNAQAGHCGALPLEQIADGIVNGREG